MDGRDDELLGADWGACSAQAQQRFALARKLCVILRRAVINNTGYRRMPDGSIDEAVENLAVHQHDNHVLVDVRAGKRRLRVLYVRVEERELRVLFGDARTGDERPASYPLARFEAVATALADHVRSWQIH